MFSFSLRVGLFVLAGVAAFAQSKPSNRHKIASELAAVDDTAMVDVIVQYSETPADAHSRRALKRGGYVKHALALINSHSYRIPASQLEELSDDPSVIQIEPDRQVTSFASPSPDYAFVSLMNLPADTGNTVSTGPAAGVAVIDSGIGQTSNFGSLWYSESFVASDIFAHDMHGHGTHVANLIAGKGSTSLLTAANYSVQGIAPAASLMNLRVLDKNGVSTDSAVIAAIQRAVKLSSLYGIRVINLSLGRPAFTSYKKDPLCQAVEAAWKAGLVVVVAAGNQGRFPGTAGYGTITSPGNDPYVITVGAMNTNGTYSRNDDKMASYSSKGPTAFDFVVKPDVVAPGNRIYSLLQPSSTLALAEPDAIASVPVTLLGGLIVGSTDFLQLSGTSMATPMVSATAALLLGQNPRWTPDQVKARIMQTATKTFPAAECPAGRTCATQALKSTTAVDAETGASYTTYYDIFTVGAGYLNTRAALSSTVVPPALSASSPTVTLSWDGTIALVNGASVVWGTSATWGSSIVWGTSVLSGNSIVWGTSIIWGTNTAAATSAIWGNSVVWGTGLPQSESTRLTLLGEK